MALRIYNTLTKRKEAFEPVKPGQVSIYLCGPTVYKESHIGHLVGPIIFDAFKRFLQYKGFKVKLVINITDVEDKLIDQAKLEGVPIAELAKRITDMYFDSLRQLDAYDSVDEFPRATENIAEIIEMVQGLIDKGLAYVVDSDVYYDIAKFEGYGQLSGRKREDQLAGSRQLQGKAKSAGDFALWKESSDNEPGWDSPWGRGRPGWHIECSAMSMKYLGRSIDIHGGGQDLIFPHHENEIAQSQGYTGQCFVKYWMHNGLTRIPTKAAGGSWKKMSKSLGNIKPIGEVLSKYDGQTVRFFVLSTHYRRPIPYSDEELDNADKALEHFDHLFTIVENLTEKDPYCLPPPAEDPPDSLGKLRQEFVGHKQRYLEHLDDDFNTAGAIGVLFDLMRRTRALAAQPDLFKDGLLWSTSLIIHLGRILGLFQARPIRTRTTHDVLDQTIEGLINIRAAARMRKDFQAADKVRADLLEMGIILEDLPDGRTIWYTKKDSPSRE